MRYEQLKNAFLAVLFVWLITKPVLSMDQVQYGYSEVREIIGWVIDLTFFVLATAFFLKWAKSRYERWLTTRPVDDHGRAFITLGEDRRYLPNVVSHLIEEADARAQSEWDSHFGRAADGRPCTDAALSVLHAAQARGYALGVTSDKAFVLTKDGDSTYLRSNSEIERFGRSLDRTRRMAS
jgi:hypothetical protein